MNNFKFFTYNISLYKGYKRQLEYFYIKSFQNIDIDGFFVISVDSNKINFKMDNQLIRKLKILKLSNEKKLSDIESKLYKLLDLSKEKENEEALFPGYHTYGYLTGTSGTQGSSVDYFDQDAAEQKIEMNKYHSRIQNYKYKQYKK